MSRNNNPNDIYAKYFVKKEEKDYSTPVIILREAEPKNENKPKITNNKRHSRFNPKIKQVVRLEQVESVEEIKKTPDKNKVRELIEMEHWQISDVAKYFDTTPQRIFQILADF